MSSEDNQIRALHGIQAKRTLDYIVDELEAYGAFANHRDKPSYGYEAHEKSQFKADKEITTSDGTKYILYSTNSIRSDRVKGQQWDSYNIKQIDSRISFAYIIIPNINALKGSVAFRNKMRNGVMFSAIDDILTVDEFYEAEIAKYGERLKGISNPISEDDAFDVEFCDVLNSKENLNRFNGVGDNVGYLYEVFYKVMRSLGFREGEIASVFATAEIPPLSDGQKPKADVLAKFVLEDGSHRLSTFAINTISNVFIHVHSGTADEFSNALDPYNERLRGLFKEFEWGSSDKEDGSDLANALKRELYPYLLDLDRWVFSGGRVSGCRDIQIAQYIITKSKDSYNIEMHDIDSYCRAQEKLGKNATDFGSVFQWSTVPGQNGRRIQLSARIIP